MIKTNRFLQGQKAFLDGKYKESIEAFSASLEHEDHPLHSQLNRGIAYLNSCQFAHAIEDFDGVIQKDILHERAFFYRGIAKLNLEENEDAIHDLDTALSLNSARGDSHFARGLAYHALGHSQKAAKDIHDCHVLDTLEPAGFMEEFVLSEPLYKQTLKVLENDTAKWNLFLTESEVRRMDGGN